MYQVYTYIQFSFFACRSFFAVSLLVLHHALHSFDDVCFTAALTFITSYDVHTYGCSPPQKGVSATISRVAH